MKNHSQKITEELAALARMRDEDIDTSDIPETVDWTGAVVGKFYRPVKEAVSLRLDADILAWFKGQGPGYQTRMNNALRNAMTLAGKPDATGRKGCHSEGATGPRRRTFRYPSLERHKELHKCERLAESIADRRSLFAMGR